MSQDCQELLPLLAARSIGLLAESEGPALEAHLSSCDACPAFAKKLATALERAKPEKRSAPEGVWERIARGIEDERAGRRAEPAPSFRIMMSCTFCHAVLDRKEAVFCASCLAPHHADCFDWHGRCSAPGCSEWRTVAPKGSETRPRRSRVRRLLVPAIALLVGGSVAALAFLPSRTKHEPVAATVEALAPVLGEPDGVPPPYPWTGPEETKIGRKLVSQKVSFNFPSSPLSEFVVFLEDITGLKVRISPDIDPEQVKVTLRLKDVVLANALRIILDQIGLDMALEEDGFVIGPLEKLPEATRHPRFFYIERLLESGPGASERQREEISQIKLDVALDGTPMGEALDFLRDYSGRNIVVAQSAQDVIDADGLKMSMTERNIGLGALLDKLLHPHEMTWLLRGDVILVTTKASEPDESAKTALLAKKVSLSLRGAVVPDLVSALKEQGVPVVAGKDTWTSRGTFSLVVKDETVEALQGALLARTSLHAWVDGEGVLVLEGVVPSVREALSTDAPKHFSGVLAEIADLRERLALDLPGRAAARADEKIDERELNRAERAVDLSANAVLALVRRARAVEKADERFQKAKKALEVENAALAAVEAELDKAGTKEAFDEREKKLASDRVLLDAEAGIVDAAKKKAEVAREQADRKKKLFETGAVTKVEADQAEAAAVEAESAARAAEVKFAAKSRDLAASQDEAKKIYADPGIEKQRIKLRIEAAKLRVASVNREIGACELDRKVLERLDRGARLAEAERALLQSMTAPKK